MVAIELSVANAFVSTACLLFDVALYSAFKTKEDLASYDANPEHAKVKRFIGAVSEKREAVDYEV